MLPPRCSLYRSCSYHARQRSSFYLVLHSWRDSNLLGFINLASSALICAVSANLNVYQFSVAVPTSKAVRATPVSIGKLAVVQIALFHKLLRNVCGFLYLFKRLFQRQVFFAKSENLIAQINYPLVQVLVFLNKRRDSFTFSSAPILAIQSQRAMCRKACRMHR
jgi:hypothetical protein